MTQQTNRNQRDPGKSPRDYNKPTFNAPTVIMVEGPDEFYFFRFLRPREDVQIHVYEGKDSLFLELKTMRSVDGFDKVRNVAIVRDADQDPQGALQSVVGHWSRAFGDTVAAKRGDEWFTDKDGRRWAVWIMPETTHAGDLEELLWRCVPAGEHRTCIDQLMACLDKCDPIPFTSKTKARLYSWLATQHDPLKELHAALNPRSGLFRRDDPVFTRFCELLDQLQPATESESEAGIE